MSEYDETQGREFMGAFEAGRDSAKVAQVTLQDGHTVVYVPKGFQKIDLGFQLPRPLSRRGVATLDDVLSFITYVNRFKDDTTLVYFRDKPDVSDVRASFLAILNGHEWGGSGLADWCDHRAVAQLRLTPEWAAWEAMNDQWIGQVEMAEFLEERLPSISEPPAADFLAAVRSLQLTSQVHFTGVVPSNHGLRLEYTEEVKHATKSGACELPDTFVLAMEPFLGSDLRGVKARLDYRLDRVAGGVKMRVKLERLDEHYRNATEMLIEDVHNRTGLDVLRGTFTPKDAR